MQFSPSLPRCSAAVLVLHEVVSTTSLRFTAAATQSFSCHFATWVSSLSLAMFYLLLPCLTAVKNMVGGWGTIHLISVIACFPAPFSRKKWHQRHPCSSPWPELRTPSKQLAVVSDFIKLLQSLEIKTLRPFIPGWWIWKTLFFSSLELLLQRLCYLFSGPCLKKAVFQAWKCKENAKTETCEQMIKPFDRPFFLNLFFWYCLLLGAQASQPSLLYHQLGAVFAS